MFLNCAFAYKLDKMRKSFCLSNSAIMAALCYRKLALFLTLKLCYNDLIIRHRRMFKPDNSFPLNIPENHPKTPEIACRYCADALASGGGALSDRSRSASRP
jgi:hypothetical protein